jgi:hypothetical protein
LFDLSSAFDLVDAGLLVEKLLIYGADCDDRTCIWVISYMLGRMPAVQVGKEVTSMTLFPCGVPQGSLATALLFVIFTADMPDSCKIASLVLDADDTTGLVVGDKVKDVYQGLEASPAEVLRYMLQNKLSLNEKKTQLLVFHQDQHSV